MVGAIKIGGEGKSGRGTALAGKATNRPAVATVVVILGVDVRRIEVEVVSIGS